MHSFLILSETIHIHLKQTIAYMYNFVLMAVLTLYPIKGSSKGQGPILQETTLVHHIDDVMLIRMIKKWQVCWRSH